MNCRNSPLSTRSTGPPASRLAASVGRQMQRRGAASDPRRSPVSSARRRRPAFNLCPLPCAAGTADLIARDFRNWFDRADYADVLLRTQPEPATSGDGSGGRLYKAHAIVLAARSGLFRTMLMDSPPDQKPKADGMDGFAHELTLPILPDEVEAMDLLLHLIYDHDPPPVTSDSVPLLFHCLKLMDKLGVQGCKSHLLEHVSAAAGDPSVLSRVCSSLPEILYDPTYDTLFSACHSVVKKALIDPSTATEDQGLVEASKRFVIAAYSDVPAVIGDEQLRKRFRSLPFAAVLAWAESDDLRVQSENCVVYLLSAWVRAAQGRGGQGVSSKQLEQLAHQVRVLHLGPAYQHHILPQLGWFKGCGGFKWLPALLACKHCHPTAGDPAEKLVTAAGLDQVWDGPKQWLAKPRRQYVMTDADRLLRWEVDSEQLEQLCDGNKVVSPTLYIGGFCMQLLLETVTKPSSEAKTLGLYRFVPHSQVNNTWSNTAAVVCGPIELKVAGRSEAGVTRRMESQAAGGTRGRGYRDMLGKSAPTMSELLAPYLRDGKLHVEARFTHVDLP